MKKFLLFSLLGLILIFAASCKNTPKKDLPESDILISAGAERLTLIGKDMITEVVVKPDSTVDPWEVEKVKGFKGKEMFMLLLEKIYNSKIKAYDCLTEKELDRATVKKMQKEVGKDVSKIGKIQFLEDWYFDPITNSISKKVRSVTFGYEVKREGGLPTGYKCLFRLKTDQGLN